MRMSVRVWREADWCFALALAGLLAIAVVQAACDMTVEKEAGQLAEAAAQIRYVREPRAGLCFAMLASVTHSGFRVTSLAAVPCEAVPPALLGRVP